MSLTRRGVIAASFALAATSAAAGTPQPFPKGFLWGAATAGHQVEGNNVNADLWVLENVRPTTYMERSGDALNHFELWPQDLDLVRDIGLNSFRFSLEWSRIEPEKGLFSVAMLDHYKRVIEGCRARGLTPIVTFNHYTTPRWFAMQGGWTVADAADLFARYCDKAARHLAADIGCATTLNEPNVARVIQLVAPAARTEQMRKMLVAAAAATGAQKFVAGNAADPGDFDLITEHQLAGHKQGRAAIKAVSTNLPVGVSLAIVDDQAVAGGEAWRDKVRQNCYQIWLEAARGDDFIGVQNYERAVWGPEGKMPPAPGAVLNMFRGEVYPASLAGAVRYAHAVSGVPVLVSEHGINTVDDSIRAGFIPPALIGLQGAINDGIPVLGYVHWTLVDNFEWSIGYLPKYGLCSVDRQTFVRTRKPSAAVLGAIARRNAV